MKKIKRSMIILTLVAIAFLYKAIQTQNLMMGVIVFLFVLLIISRYFIIKLLSQDDGKQMDSSTDFIERYLQVDPILFSEMQVVYHKGKCDILYEENDGILLYDHTSLNYLASAKTLAGARDIARKLPQDYGVFIAHEDFFKEIANQDLNYKNTMTFYNYVYEKKARYIIPENAFTFKMLDESNLEIIKDNYSIEALCNDEYILGRIKEGMMGAFIEDEIVGFIGLHDNGSIGLLEVFAGYEGRHIATYLQCSFVNYLIDTNYQEIIYTQVSSKNDVSMHIQKKLKFEKASKPVYWYFS